MIRRMNLKQRATTDAPPAQSAHFAPASGTLLAEIGSRARSFAGPFIAFSLAAALAALVSGRVHAQPVPTPQWFAEARSLIVEPEAERVWGRCDADGTAALAGTLFLGGSTHCRMMLVDGTPRRFVVYTPQFFVQASPTLVIMFHGTSQHGEHFLIESTWRTLADMFGFVVAFPTGLEYQVKERDTGFVAKKSKWNSYGLDEVLDPDQLDWRPPQFSPSGPWPADDVKFTTAIIDDIGQQLPIDRCRIFVSGFSNGGAFVARLAVDLPSVIAAGGAVTSLYQEAYAPSESIPLYFAQGTADEHLRDAIERGGDPRPDSQDLLDPAQVFGYQTIIERVDATLTTLGLSKIAQTTTDAAPRTFMQRTWPVPRVGAGPRAWFRWALWRGVNHKYPRGPANEHGSDNQYNFDAAVEFWNFFTQHPRVVCP